MKILVLNCGSSSIKYQVFDMDNEHVLAKGLVERVGIDGTFIKHQKGEAPKITRDTQARDHKEGIKKVIDMLLDKEQGVITGIEEIVAVGHRVVHGGEKFADSVLITPEVLDAVKECITFAPLHNPPNLKGIEAMSDILPKVPQVAVFDTAFHQSMPPLAYLYGIPYSYYEKDRIRRYGFHGTSHRYVSKRAAQLLNRPYEKMKIITCHLGNGASIAAINGGHSVDTSMGHTPLEGLVMGTRCGDLDPALVLHIMKKDNLSIQEMDNLLNKKSGILGLSGMSSDQRDLEEGYPEKNLQNNKPMANLALEIFSYRVRKYVGAYMAVLNGCDALVFTAGVGENSPIIRDLVCRDLDFLGVKLDAAKNEKTWRGAEGDISTPDARVRTLVIPTNEELVIAEDTYEIVKKIKK
jgi:acetate kinase